MNKLITTGLLIGLSTGAFGCSFLKRDTTRYRNDTTAMLEKNHASLKACYDDVLKNKSDASGTVVVKFKLKNETGKVFDVKVDESASTAPKEVQDCVEQTVNGLAIDPPDAVEGHATFTYKFEIAPQKAPQPTSSDFKTDGKSAG